jgi:hypothetical protein
MDARDKPGHDECWWKCGSDAVMKPTQKPRINSEWHAANRMPKKATPAQKIAWHLQHAQVCGCRPMPKSIENEIKARMLLARRPQSP